MLRPRRVSADEAGQRLDRYLRRAFPFAPYTLVHKWLRSGQVRLNGARVKADARLSQDDLVRLPPQGTARSVHTPEEMRTHRKLRTFDKKTLSLLRQRIVLERENFFLLDKPAGLACQGGRGVVQALDRQLLALAEVHSSLGMPRLVHRIDRATSGLLLVAKNRRAAADLASLFREGKVRKTYCAILEGIPKRSAKEQTDTKTLEKTTPSTLTYRTPLVSKFKGEQEATTHLFLLAQNEKLDRALVLLRPISGRKHQLRRHMAEAGTPIVGERLYATRTQHANKVENKAGRIMLHALRLVIEEEGSGESGEADLTHARRYAVDARLPPPSDFLAACASWHLDSGRLDSWHLDSWRLKDSCFDPFV